MCNSDRSAKAFASRASNVLLVCEGRLKTNNAIGASFILFFIGVAVSTIYSELIKKEDPPEVVIDEWVGQWIALWLIPHSFAWGFLSFTIFRIFDILKLGPVKGMDDIKSGTGIMMDDVVAGIFALLITQSLIYFTG